jgi:hypothetical protein
MPGFQQEFGSGVQDFVAKQITGSARRTPPAKILRCRASHGG